MDILVGAHTSAAGGVHNALLHGQEIGATTIQLFTSNQKTWTGKILGEKEIELWKDAKHETGISHVMSHDSYLINLGSPDPLILAKSRKAFAEEIVRCHQLELTYLNFHPGAYTISTLEEGLNTIVESLLGLSKEIHQGNTRLLFEVTAGQGSAIGWRFDEIGYLIEKTEREIPVGVCIDTCHIFVAGYDIRTEEGWENTLKEFDEKVGLKHLYAMHLNDSMHPLGARRDRHAPLGTGHIGMDSFRVLMTHPKLIHLPKYLETPDPTIWGDEIALLKSFTESSVHGKSHGKTA